MSMPEMARLQSAPSQAASSQAASSQAASSQAASSQAACWTADTRYFEYTSAADPEMAAVPIATLPAESHQQGPTGVITFDLSEQLQCDWPATTPNLLANFVHLLPGEAVGTQAESTSQLFYVIRGAGQTEFAPIDGEGGQISWAEGDIFVLPAAARSTHQATEDAALYWVHDAPLLSYLGVKPTTARFRATHYRHEQLQRELDAVAQAPGAEGRNRRGILLGNAATPQTLTITHTLWSLLNILPANSFQKPHRHNSVALDLCVSAGPDTYTLIGEELTEDGQVANPSKADWISGSAFVTPPMLWHSHHNESDQNAVVLPIQDAGLCTYMRILDIRFSY